MDAFGQFMARAIVWSIGLGAATGGVVGAIAVMASPEYLLLAVPYGSAIGSIVGFLIGVPVALLTALIARRTQCWRVGGTVVATGATVAVVGWVMGDGQSSISVIALVSGVLVAANAWIALPRIVLVTQRG